MDQKIVIQLAPRKSILNALNAAYQGVSAMRAWAMDSGLLARYHSWYCLS